MCELVLSNVRMLHHVPLDVGMVATPHGPHQLWLCLKGTVPQSYEGPAASVL